MKWGREGEGGGETFPVSHPGNRVKTQKWCLMILYFLMVLYFQCWGMHVAMTSNL
jgi:hypothetical protein